MDYLGEPVFQETFKWQKTYFASSDPHHGIQFIPSDILSGKSSGILFGILFEILSGAYLLAFYLSYLLTFYLAYLSGIPSGMSSDILSRISSDILSVISSDILSGILFGISSDILSGILFGILYGFVSGRWGPVKVRRGPQRAGSRRLKSGEAHSAQTLAGWRPSPVEVRRGPQRSDSRRFSPVEVRRGPLLSRAGRWDLARPAIKSWQMRSGEEEGGRRKDEEGRRSRASDIKSNNPHLAGGEKNHEKIASKITKHRHNMTKDSIQKSNTIQYIFHRITRITL